MCEHAEVFKDGTCAACGLFATGFPGLGNGHRLIARPGQTLTPRPKDTDPDIIHAAAVRAFAILKDLDDGEPLDENATIELLERTLKHHYNGYERAKKWEHEGWSPDRELVKFLDDLDAHRETRTAIAKWVEAEKIRSAFPLNSKVSVPHRRGERVTGVIYALDEVFGEARVRCMSLGHVLPGENGTQGLIIAFEDLREV